MNYLQRYLAGEHEAVYDELVALGAAVRQEPVYAEARAVAQAMMQQARHNIELLIARLYTLGYQFYAERPLEPLDADALAALDELERRLGPLPVVLRAWYELVGAVSLVGYHPRLSAQFDLEPDSRALGAPSSDPLEVSFGVYELFDELAIAEEEDAADAFGPPYSMPIAPDTAHKAGYSGGGPLVVIVPDEGFDGLLDSENWGNASFVPYLRACFRAGGFPGLVNDQPAAESARAELAVLTRDLLPI